MKQIITFLMLLAVTLGGVSCKKDENRKDEQEQELTVNNKLIIGEWRHQSTQLNVYDVTTGAAKSIQDYDIPQIKTLIFTAEGKFSSNPGNSGTYGINAAGTVLSFKNAGGKMSTSEVRILNEKQLTILSTEISEGTRLVLLQSFVK